MEEIIIAASWIVLFVQLVLCFKVRKKLVKSIPALLILLLQAALFVWYAVSDWTNWGCLILMLLLLIPMGAVGTAWILYVITKFILDVKKKHLT